MERLLRDSGGSLTYTNYDAAGAPADVNGNAAPTIAVSDSAGTAVAGVTATRSSAGVYAIAIPVAATSTLDVYDLLLTWANGEKRRGQYEIVGGFLFEVADLRSFDVDLADAARYPAATIRAVRNAVEDTFEAKKVTGLAFRPRGRREWLDGDARDRLILEEVETTRLVSVIEDTVPVDVSTLVLYPFGMVRRTNGGWSAASPRNIQVLYEFGLKSVPADIFRAAMRLARHALTKNAIEQNDRATAIITELGGYRLTLAGRDGRTGLPEVDAVLAEWSRVKPGAFA